jgi:hypothetical protein
VIAAVILAAGFVLCVSVGTTLAGMVVCVVWLALQGRSQRRIAILWLLPLLTCALVAVLLAPPQLRERFADITHNDSAAERIEAFGDALKIAGDNPLFGSGLGVFEVRLMQVQNHYYESKYVHNQYLQVLDETGAIGLCLWLTLLGATFVKLWRYRRDNPALANALLACFVLAALHSAIDFEFSFAWYMTFMCGMWAIVDGIDYAEPRFAMPQYLSVSTHFANAVVLACILLASVGNLYATARYEQLAVQAGSVELADLEMVVDTGLHFDPFNAADYKVLWLDTVGDYQVPPDGEARSQRYVADLEAMTNRSVTACETLADYAEAQGDLAASARYRALILRVRPLDPAWQNE